MAILYRDKQGNLLTEDEARQKFPEKFASFSRPTTTQSVAPKKSGSMGDFFPGQEIGKSLVQAGSNIKNLVTGGRAKYEQGLNEGNRVDVPALIGDYLQAGATVAVPPTAKAAATASKAGKLGAVAKNVVAGAGTGYAYDVGSNLKQGDRGSAMLQPGAGTAIGAALPAAGAVLSGVGKAAETSAAKNISNKDFALELTSPRINRAAAREAFKKGSGGVKQRGMFGKFEVEPTDYDRRVAESVRDVVSPKKRLIENVDAIKRKIDDTDKGVTEFISQNNAIFNENQLRTKLAQAKDNHRLLFAGDNATEATYDAVVDEFINQIKRKDTSGLFETRKGFDRYLKTKLPNLFKKDATGQFLDPRDSIRSNAALDVRRAANEYIAELLPEGNKYRAELLRESDMIEAIARIADKNAGKISMKNLQILSQNYPILMGLAKTIGAGAVAAVALSPVYAATSSNN